MNELVTRLRDLTTTWQKAISNSLDAADAIEKLIQAEHSYLEYNEKLLKETVTLAQRIDALEREKAELEQWSIGGFAAVEWKARADFLALEVDYFKSDATTFRAQRDEANARVGLSERLYRLLASAWFYGGWKAETVNEQAMEAVMREAGWWPFESEDALLAAVAEPAPP